MAWLRENGYYTLSPEEAFLVLTENRMPSEKCVWLTFDDGYTDNYTEAFPILKENDMKATVFMIGKSIDKGHHLTENQMLEMSRDGISIESHTISHLELNHMTEEQQEAEMVQSKVLFDRILDQDTTVLSYRLAGITKRVSGCQKKLDTRWQSLPNLGGFKGPRDACSASSSDFTRVICQWVCVAD